MAENKILISLEVDDKGTVKIKQFGDETNKAAKEGENSLASFREGWVATTAKITAFAAAAYGAARVINSFVSEAAEAESIEKRLQFALETTGYSWKHAKSAVDDFAVSIQNTTRFSDEQARQALTDLMMYTQDFSKAQMGAKLAMDMSVRTGHDLGSATRLIGMAMTGNVEMLGRYLPQLRNLDTIFGENATMAQKAEYAMKIFQEKFGGTAQADLNTYSGKVAQFKNAWSDFKEEIGNKVLPVLGDLFQWLTKIIKSIQEFGGAATEKGKAQFELSAVERRIEDFSEMAKSYEAAGMKGPVAGLLKQIEELATRRQEILSRIRDIQTKETEGKGLLGGKKDIFSDAKQIEMQAALEGRKMADLLRQGMFEEWSRESLLKAADLQTTMDRLGGVLSGLEFTYPAEDILPDLMQIKNEYGEILTVTKDYYQKLRDAKLEAAELLAITRQQNQWTGAEFTFPTEDILPDWMSHPKTGKPVQVQQWKDEVDQMKDYFMQFSENISSVWAENVKGIISQGKSLGDALKNIFTGMADAFVSAIAKMIANWVLFGDIKGAVSGAETGFGILGWLAKGIGISAWQEGGIVNRPTLSMIGEGGPEAVIPLKSGKIPIEGGGQTITNIYYVNAIDTQSFDLAIRRNSGSIIKVVKGNIDRNGPLRGK